MGAQSIYRPSDQEIRDKGIYDNRERRQSQKQHLKGSEALEKRNKHGKPNDFRLTSKAGIDVGFEPSSHNRRDRPAENIHYSGAGDNDGYHGVRSCTDTQSYPRFPFADRNDICIDGNFQNKKRTLESGIGSTTDNIGNFKNELQNTALTSLNNRNNNEGEQYNHNQNNQLPKFTNHISPPQRLVYEKVGFEKHGEDSISKEHYALNNSHDSHSFSPLRRASSSDSVRSLTNFCAYDQKFGPFLLTYAQEEEEKLFDDDEMSESEKEKTENEFISAGNAVPSQHKYLSTVGLSSSVESTNNISNTHSFHNNEASRNFVNSVNNVHRAKPNEFDTGELSIKRQVNFAPLATTSIPHNSHQNISHFSNSNSLPGPGLSQHISREFNHSSYSAGSFTKPRPQFDCDSSGRNNIHSLPTASNSSFANSSSQTFSSAFPLANSCGPGRNSHPIMEHSREDAAFSSHSSNKLKVEGDTLHDGNGDSFNPREMFVNNYNSCTTENHTQSSTLFSKLSDVRETTVNRQYHSGQYNKEHLQNFGPSTVDSKRFDSIKGSQNGSFAPITSIQEHSFRPNFEESKYNGSFSGAPNSGSSKPLSSFNQNRSMNINNSLPPTDISNSSKNRNFRPLQHTNSGSFAANELSFSKNNKSDGSRNEGKMRSQISKPNNINSSSSSHNSSNMNVANNSSSSTTSTNQGVSSKEMPNSLRSLFF